MEGVGQKEGVEERNKGGAKCQCDGDLNALSPEKNVL